LTVVDAELRVDSRREYGVDLISAMRHDFRWQFKAGEGFAASDFTINWDQQQATSPEGRTSTNRSPAVDRGRIELIKIKFSAKDCGECPARARCTKTKLWSINVRLRD
jgi:transposase